MSSPCVFPPSAPGHPKRFMHNVPATRARNAAPERARAGIVGWHYAPWSGDVYPRLLAQAEEADADWRSVRPTAPGRG